MEPGIDIFGQASCQCAYASNSSQHFTAEAKSNVVGTVTFDVGTGARLALEPGCFAVVCGELICTVRLSKLNEVANWKAKCIERT
jgi:hypothetical protein